jgi:excisionase family DNA binding protein
MTEPDKLNELTPHRYTMGEAARAVGLSKGTLSRAIANGSLSAEKQPNGSYRIDSAELYRVWLPKRSAVNELTPDNAVEVERLKARVEGLEQLNRQIEGERDRLHEHVVRLTALLPPPPPIPAAPKIRRWWQRRESA